MSPVRLRLRELREAAGLTQAALADRAGLRQATINDLEHHSQRIEYRILDALCKALRCEPGDLLIRERR